MSTAHHKHKRFTNNKSLYWGVEASQPSHTTGTIFLFIYMFVVGVTHIYIYRNLSFNIIQTVGLATIVHAPIVPCIVSAYSLSFGSGCKCCTQQVGSKVTFYGSKRKLIIISSHSSSVVALYADK